MRYLLTFYGSCGHTTVEEVSAEFWAKMAGKTSEELTRAHPLGLTIQENYWVECCDGTARMVYIYPLRFTICAACAREEVEVYP